MNDFLMQSGLLETAPEDAQAYLEEMIEGLAQYALARDLPATSAMLSACAKLADQEFRADPLPPEDNDEGPRMIIT
ncbi:hypothetical protein [Woodsholea maritima]|uniref:hypothetical protein n=1 Tax=Woodsholea maritima TaxID=240237 RepID=UPI00036EBB75|nr:hypothetical protein [Woodsholea maritima]